MQAGLPSEVTNPARRNRTRQSGRAVRESTGAATTREGLEHLIAEREKERHLLDGEIGRQRAKVEEASDIAMQIAEVDEQIARTRELYDAVHREIEVQLMEGKAPARI